MRKQIILVVAVIGLTSCERPTKVSFETTDGITFRMSGGGSLGQLVVYGPEYIEKATSPSDRSFALWLLEPTAGYLHGAPISSIGQVKYGSVPEGYKQLIPDGKPPEPLTPGLTYYLVISSVDATGASGFFQIRGGRAEFVHVPHPCFGLDSAGKWKRVKCIE